MTSMDASTTATPLARRVAAIPDVGMRVRYVRYELSQMEPEMVADVVAIAANLTETRIPPNPELLLSISQRVVRARARCDPLQPL